jgi:hypothetical protein
MCVDQRGPWQAPYPAISLMVVTSFLVAGSNVVLYCSGTGCSVWSRENKNNDDCSLTKSEPSAVGTTMFISEDLAVMMLTPRLAWLKKTCRQARVKSKEDGQGKFYLGTIGLVNGNDGEISNNLDLDN